MTEKGFVVRPIIKAAAERHGFRTDDVTGTSFDFETSRVIMRHSDGRITSFPWTDADKPPACPTCGRR